MAFLLNHSLDESQSCLNVDDDKAVKEIKRSITPIRLSEDLGGAVLKYNFPDSDRENPTYLSSLFQTNSPTASPRPLSPRKGGAYNLRESNCNFNSDSTCTSKPPKSGRILKTSPRSTGEKEVVIGELRKYSLPKLKPPRQVQRRLYAISTSENKLADADSYLEGLIPERSLKSSSPRPSLSKTLHSAPGSPGPELGLSPRFEKFFDLEQLLGDGVNNSSRFTDSAMRQSKISSKKSRGNLSELRTPQKETPMSWLAFGLEEDEIATSIPMTSSPLRFQASPLNIQEESSNRDSAPKGAWKKLLKKRISGLSLNITER